MAKVKKKGGKTGFRIDMRWTLIIYALVPLICASLILSASIIGKSSKEMESWTNKSLVHAINETGLAFDTAIETAGAHVAERLQGTVDYLCDIAAVAPLVGLLGTVLGMFQAFGGIANDLAAAARPVVLAQGVSQAIVTTVFGLVVAIPCLAAYAFLRRRTARRIAELESIGVGLEQAAE